MIFSAMDESTQARQNALVCQGMAGGHISDGILEFSWLTAPETEDHKQVQREA